MTTRDTRFEVPFPMAAAVAEGPRQAQMAACLRQQLPRLWPVPIGEASLSIACYGPSLADTWRDLTRPILSTSGAHDFLIARGVVPDFHVDVDPRPHKVAHVLTPHRDVQYLMASVCHPFTWAVLRGFNVRIFHVVSGANTYAWLQLHDPRSLLIVGGSSVGLAALHVGGVLGYRHFEVHGMDGCFRGATRHAGDHFGHTHPPISWTARGRTWQTSKIMQNSNVELLNMLRNFPFFVVLHGDGLMQDMLAEADLDNGALAGTEKAAHVRRASIEAVA